MRISLRRKFLIIVGSILAATFGFAWWIEGRVDAIYDEQREMRSEWRELELMFEVNRNLYQLAQLIDNFEFSQQNGDYTKIDNGFGSVLANLAKLKKFQGKQETAVEKYQKDEWKQINLIEQSILHSKNIWKKYLLSKAEWNEALEQDLIQSIQKTTNITYDFVRVTHDEFNKSVKNVRGFEDSIDETITVLIIFMPLIVLALAASFYTGVLLPVRRLHKSATALRQHDFSDLPELRKGDELGDLSNAFREMALEIEQFTGNLEKRVEDQARDLIRSQKMAGIGRLAAGVAHEINNPLASILTCAEGLLRRLEQNRDALDTENAREYLQTICKEVRRSNLIIEQMLDFSRKKPSVWKENNAVKILQDAIGLMRHTAEKHSCRIQLQLPGHPVWLHCDADQLQQVLVNLIINSIDACESEGLIQLALIETDSGVTIKVSDNGCGMAKEEIEHVFEPFYSKKQNGTGLGLAVSHGIIENHNGTITAFSEGEEKGTTFTIALNKEGNSQS